MDILERSEKPAAASDVDAVAVETIRDIRRDARNKVVMAWTIRLVALPAVLMLWEVLVNAGFASEQIVSKPSKIIVALANYLQTGEIYGHIWATLTAATWGLIVGSLVGVTLGVIFSSFPTLERALRPYLTLLNALPRPALAPVFLVWFGLGGTAKVITAASIVMFIMMLNTISGFSAVPADIRNLSDSLAMNRWQRFIKVDVPASLPIIAAGLQLSAVYAVLGVIVTEMVASYEGLGQVLVLATSNIQMDKAFAVLLISALIALMLSGVVALWVRSMNRVT
jgi:NitT/TauT family transport system permease protein